MINTTNCYMKIIECFNLTRNELLVEVQHYQNGIPPNTKIFDCKTDETWVVKKRVHHGILILNDSEIFFDCETDSIHVDNVFKNLEDREKAVEKELNKRKNRIYSYLIKPEKKKQKLKPEKGAELKIK